MIIAPNLIAAAKATQAKWQVPASLSLSACGIESSFFTKMPPGSLNGFGIKARPGEAQVNVATGEQTPAGATYTIHAGFRVFASVEDAFDAYGHLLGLGGPYRAMMTAFLRSPRAPEDVQALSNALTGVYASAINYGASLIFVQKEYNLYQYDKETPMVDTPAPVAPKVPDVVAENPPRVTPTVSQPIRVDWGSWAEQFLAHETGMIEAAVNTGLNIAESAAPYGFMIKMFVGEKVVDQLIEQGLKVLEGVLDKKSFAIDASNPLAIYVLNMVNTIAPQLAASLGSKLDGLIKAGLIKVGAKL